MKCSVVEARLNQPRRALEIAEFQKTEPQGITELCSFDFEAVDFFEGCK